VMGMARPVVVAATKVSLCLFLPWSLIDSVGEDRRVDVDGDRSVPGKLWSRRREIVPVLQVRSSTRGWGPATALTTSSDAARRCSRSVM
jgi:hypothetical protein